MTDDRIAELEKEVRELNLKLEIERQKNRKLEARKPENQRKNEPAGPHGPTASHGACPGCRRRRARLVPSPG